MSFMYTGNKRSPKTDSWGTPDVTGELSEFVPLTTTFLQKYVTLNKKDDVTSPS